MPLFSYPVSRPHRVGQGTLGNEVVELNAFAITSGDRFPATETY
jgi:hypothetical protein